MSEIPDEPLPPGRRSRRALLLLVPIAIFVASVSFRSSVRVTIAGQMTSTGGVLGAWTWEPDGCERSKDSSGVDLARGRFVRMRVEPDVVTVFPPGAAPDTKFARAQCRTFDVVIERELTHGSRRGTSTDTAYKVGALTLDCDEVGGGTLRGSVKFAHCD
jgi:hypothetical protein